MGDPPTKVVTRTVLGVDPGHTTALVVRRGRDVLDRAVVHLNGGNVHQLLADSVTAMHRLDAEHCADLVAVEGLVAPTGHLGMTAIEPLLVSAQVLGALVHALGGEAVVVRPNRHGRPPAALERLPAGAGRTRALSAWLRQSYPPALIGPRETTGGGKSDWQHLRSAFDVAGAAERQTRSVQAQFGLTT